jgi:hypothetical protein
MENENQLNEFINDLENGELRSNTVSTRDFHTAIAQVGKDIIENAEYFTFDHSDWWEPKKMKWFEKVWDVITTPYYKAKWKIKDTYWEVRYGFERMFKGYDSVDTFETFAKFIERYTKILKDLRNCHYGYPGNISEEEWDTILDEMIYHLHYMDEETVTEALEKDVPDDWVASSKTAYEIMDKHKREFFKLFSEYFYDLWD